MDPPPDPRVRLLLDLRPSSSRLGELEQELRASPDPRLRRLALEALVQAASPKNGWTAERRELLERYRKDPSPAVAGPASFIMPP
ncbi:hypothetical protein WMF27_09265 [Sorangium sp. So ce281]|uniref:hypothetical protein n=1 Tax=unclassified Sorangium TaxID=2621164 RepID=UPI003F62478A